MASLAAKIAITICLTIFSILVLTIFFVVVFDQLYDDENYNYNKHHIKKGTVFANILLSKPQFQGSVLEKATLCNERQTMTQPNLPVSTNTKYDSFNLLFTLF